MRRRVCIQRLHLRPRPRRPPQELERRADARVVREAADRDALAEAAPAVALDEVLEHGLERDAVQRVGAAGRVHPQELAFLERFGFFPALLSATASRTSALNAVSSTSSPSRMS